MPKSDGGFMFWCPGCETYHGTDGRWDWTDTDTDHPTCSPSILVHPHKGTPGYFPDQPRCHTFIKNGKIEYQGDCEHALKGQTIPMYDVDTCEAIV